MSSSLVFTMEKKRSTHSDHTSMFCFSLRYRISFYKNFPIFVAEPNDLTLHYTSYFSLSVYFFILSVLFLTSLSSKRGAYALRITHKSVAYSSYAKIVLTVSLLINVTQNKRKK